MIDFIAQNRVAIGFSILLYLCFVIVILSAMGNAADFDGDDNKL